MTQHLPLRQLMKPIPTKVGLTALQVSNFYTLYFFLAGGIIIAAVYFAVEITMVKKQHVNHMKHNVKLFDQPENDKYQSLHFDPWGNVNA